MKVRWFHRFLVVMLGLAAATDGVAQVQTGSILVRTVDEQGAVMPGVTVTIASPALVTGTAVGVTDAGGVYRFPALPPGSYSVKLDLAGFQTVELTSVGVLVGQTTPLEQALKVAAVAETITVTGEKAVIDTTSANVNVTLSQQLLQQTPGGRDIWSLVEYKVPGLISSRPDVGGASGGLQGGMSARGTPNTQNTQFLNGINVGDPAAVGYTGFYYDYDAFEEIQVSTGAQDLSVPAAGVFLNMVTKSGGNQVHGKAQFLFQNDATQGSNVDDELMQFGFRSEPPAAGAVKFVSDANFQIGGPIVRNKLRYFASFRDWRVHVNVPDYPEVESTDITSGLGNVTWQVSDRNRVTGFYARQYYKKPHRGASALFTPESAWNEDDVFDIVQGLWNSVLSGRSFLDARFTFNKIDFPLFQKGSGQSLLDRASGLLTRAAQTEQIFVRKRFQANANLQYYVDRALGGRHEIRFGVDHAHMPTTTAVHRIDDLNLFYNSQTSANYQVQVFNSPVNSASTVDQSALYAQDAYSVEHLTISGGVRWERVEGYLPEQSSPPSQWFASQARQFDAVNDIPLWHTIGPRVSVVYDLGGKGRTAIKASAGRYYYTISTGTPNIVNPNFNVSETYAWNDLNGDLSFQPAEKGVLQARAGALIASFDPDVKRPYTNAYSAGVDHELVNNLKISAVFTYTEERNVLGPVDTGVPDSAYSLVGRTDIGRDGLSGTSDDATIFVWNQDAATIGQNRLSITNRVANNQLYRGLELTANKRLSNRWQMLVGYTLAKTIVNGYDAFTAPGLSTPLTPNQLINARGVPTFDRRHTFKSSGSYLLPRDIRLSGNFRAQSGQGFTRLVPIALNQGTVNINAEPRGSYKADPLVTLDLQVAKTFTFGDHLLEVSMDVYNLTNANTVWDIRTGTGRTNFREGGVPTGEINNLPTFGAPVSILGPRIFRFGAAFRF